MISHWDDVPWKRHEHGELRCERQGLSHPRGGAGATLSRYRIAPGARSMPQHVHVDEEELFFVLAGAGLSWQGDAVHEVRAGDLIVHVADREAHTLIASGDEALDVLAFASGSPTGLTHLPRAGVSWVGSRWIPPDALHPFEAEPPAGELPATMPRPTTIVALDDVERRLRDRGPGRRSAVRHCHSHDDELFVVLEGAGTLLLGDEHHAVRPGSIVARPPATGIAHAFEAGADGVVVLAYGTREAGDMCWYPDSQKISFRSLRVIGRLEPLNYWDGEE